MIFVFQDVSFYNAICHSIFTAEWNRNPISRSQKLPVRQASGIALPERGIIIHQRQRGALMNFTLHLYSLVLAKTTEASVTEQCVYSGPATAQVACPLLHRKSESKLRCAIFTRHTNHMTARNFVPQRKIKCQNSQNQCPSQISNSEAASILIWSDC